MNILLAASEAVPFCKTGGLADVVGALAKAFGHKRHSVVLILPFYRLIKTQFPKIKKNVFGISVPFGHGMEAAQVGELKINDRLKVYFVDSHFFDREGVYGETSALAYSDNDQRFAFFCRSVFEICKKLSFIPDVIHCHDWQTGLVPAYLHHFYRQETFFSKTRCLFTIHNMAYQGNFSASSIGSTGLPLSAYNLKELEFYGKISYLKSGLVYSDGINTVSPTYAKEISTDPHFGCGMEGLLQERKTRFRGILNGLDTKIWDPSRDSYLALPFNHRSLENRNSCKEDLQKTVGLPIEPDSPLISFVGRMDYQKGVDLLVEMAPGFLSLGAQFAVLGQGDPSYISGFQNLARRFPSQVRVETSFAEPIAHKIYGGSDIFLMPSRFEPCGLSQLIAMRYGCIPVVTPSGGLLDTVIPYSREAGTGFISNDHKGSSFLYSVQQAMGIYRNTKTWVGLQKRAMEKDSSWSSSVDEYLSFYKWIQENKALSV